MARLSLSPDVASAVVRPHRWLLALLWVLGFMSAGYGYTATPCEDAPASASFKAATMHCQQVYTFRVFQNFTNQDLKSLQQALRSIGYDTLGVDGLLGVHTVAALARFSADLAVDDYPGLPGSVADALPKYADYARETPHWRQLVKAPDFAQWLSGQSTARQLYFKALQASGAVLPITIVVDYKPLAGVATPPAPTPVSPAPEPDPPATVPAQTNVQDTSTVYYLLNEDDFSELAARGVVLQQLATLKDIEYPSEYALQVEVEKNLGAVTKLSSEYAAIVLKTAQKNISYRLTQQSFDAMSLDNVPDAAQALLQTLKNLPFASVNKVNTAVVKRMKPAARPVSNSSSGTQKKDTADPGSASVPAPKAETPPAPDYSEYVAKVTQQVQKVTVYKLTDQSFTELAGNIFIQAIPDTLLKMIAKLQDVDYIGYHQFVQAIGGTLEVMNRYYQRLIVQEAGVALRLTKTSLDNLKSNGVPEYILDAVTPLENQLFTQQKALTSAIQAVLAEMIKGFPPYYPVLAQQARRVASDSLSPIRWSGGTCGCSREDLSGVVYGLYPFWLADQVTVPEGALPLAAKQELDFSVLTRIGYYGLYLDDKGGIDQSRHWNNHKDAIAFVRTARKYRSKLDLVVYTDAWSSWTDTDIENAASTVAEEMNLPVPAGAAERFKSLVPFANDTNATMGNGVTVYFVGYSNPENANKRRNITGFVQKLSEKLTENARSVLLNIMLDVDWAAIEGGGGVFSGLKTGNIDIAKYVDLVLVLLDEPTTDTKKKLRSDIENEFKGEDRKIMLRKIVPVISPMGQNKDPLGAYAQFTDDLIYFQDNFAGVGLWTLPLKKNAEAPEINSLIVKYFQQPSQQDFIKRMASVYVPQLCDFACPNRWLFRIAFDILAVLLIFVLILSRIFCRLCQWLKQHPWPLLWLLAVTILVFSVSLVCDPFWQQRRDSVLIGLLLVGVLIWLWYYIRRLNQGELP